MAIKRKRKYLVLFAVFTHKIILLFYSPIKWTLNCILHNIKFFHASKSQRDITITDRQFCCHKVHNKLLNIKQKKRYKDKRERVRDYEMDQRYKREERCGRNSQFRMCVSYNLCIYIMRVMPKINFPSKTSCAKMKINCVNSKKRKPLFLLKKLLWSLIKHNESKYQFCLSIAFLQFFQSFFQHKLYKSNFFKVW